MKSVLNETGNSCGAEVKTDESMRLRQFASRAIGLNRTFSGLQKLLFRTKLLALNAEIACARIGKTGVAFDVVAKDLITLGDLLRHDVVLLQTKFSAVAHHVGVLIRARQRFRSYLAVIDAVNQQAGSDEGVSRVRGLSLLSAEVMARYEEQDARRKRTPLLASAWEKALRCRKEATEHLSAVDVCFGGLQNFLRRLSYTATRQSGFLATTARVEASHVDQTEFDLDAVAEDIQALARDFASIQTDANNAVGALTGEAETILRQARLSEGQNS